jgi:hypothetical protein
MVYDLSDNNIKLTEIAISLILLVVFVALFALVDDYAAEWSNILYVGLLLTFTLVFSAIGFKLAPRSY